jgi:colicin import membrane protein
VKALARAKVDFAAESKLRVSLGLSIIIHTAVFMVIIFSVAGKSTPPQITVSLLKNADPSKKIIKAGFVDANAMEQAHKRIVEQQQRAEQQKREAEQAEIAKKAEEQKALELAILQKQQLEVQAKAVAAKKAADQKALQVKNEQAKQKKIKDAALKETAQRQAAAIKANRDKLQAEHNALLATELERLKAQIRAVIKESKIISPFHPNNTSCDVTIKLLPDGSILNVYISKPSGHPAYDDMQISAIQKAAPFSIPQDHELYEEIRDGITLNMSNDLESSDA